MRITVPDGTAAAEQETAAGDSGRRPDKQTAETADLNDRKKEKENG